MHIAYIWAKAFLFSFLSYFNFSTFPTAKLTQHVSPNYKRVVIQLGISFELLLKIKDEFS